MKQIYDSVLDHYKAKNLTATQKCGVYLDLQKVCGMFKDGYDRAVALELEYKWDGVDAALVKILHVEV